MSRECSVCHGLVVGLITTPRQAARAGLQAGRAMFRPWRSRLEAERTGLGFPQMRAASEPVRRVFRLAFREAWAGQVLSDAQPLTTEKETS